MKANRPRDDDGGEGVGLLERLVALLSRFQNFFPATSQVTLTINRHVPGSLLQRRHARLTRCMPSFLVVGTQKGGTSSLHYLLKNGWHDGIQVNNGEKEIHYFSWDDNFRKGPLVYQQRFDGSGDRLGVCADEAKTRGEVSATHLDYPSPSPSPSPSP